MAIISTLLGFKAAAMDISGSFDRADGYATLIANDALMYEEDAAKIRKFLSTHAAAGRPTAIFLTSQGGYAELAEMFADAIVDPSNQLNARTGLRNVLIINDECSSGCAIMTAAITSKYDPAALKIVIAPATKFEFHSPVELVPEKPGSNKMVLVPYRDPKERQRRIEIQISHLRQFGVNPQWLSDNEQMFYDSKMVRFSGKQLCEQNSMIIPPTSCATSGSELTENELAALGNEVQVAQAALRNKLAARKNAPKNTLANEQRVLDKMQTQPAEAKRDRPQKQRR